MQRASQFWSRCMLRACKAIVFVHKAGRMIYFAYFNSNLNIQAVLYNTNNVQFKIYTRKNAQPVPG